MKEEASGIPTPPRAQDASNEVTAAAGAAPALGAVVRCFSEVTPSDGRLDFQVIDLGRQVYVWVAAGGAKLGGLCFSISSPAGGASPATAVLLRGGAGASGEGLAQRLALKLGRPVLCSCNLAADAALLQAVAERRLLRELSDMAAARGCSGAGAGGGGASGGTVGPSSSAAVA